MSYIGSTPTTQSFIAGTDYFNGTGSQVAFTLSRSVNSVNDIEVIVNNVEQIPSGYSVSGTTLTFSAAPSAGTSNVYVRYLSTTNLSLAIPSGTSATFNTVTATNLTATTLAATNLSYTGTLTGAAATFSGIVAANGGGIQFPATQVASADANTLDDYEEGTWTPALAGEGGGSNTFTVKYGYYTKVGRLVTVSFATSGIASPNAQTGNWVITGLPFTSANFSSTQAVLWGGSFSHYRQFPVQASSTGLFPACKKNDAVLRISVMYGGPAQTESGYVTGNTPSSILEFDGSLTYETA